VLEKGEDANISMEKIGIFARNIVWQAFDSQGFGKWASLKPKTIKRKGSSKVLVDTAILKNSITYIVKGKK
jgi:hypothetical protein